MKWIVPADKIGVKDRSRVGGKGFALAELARNGFSIPETLCVTADAYRGHVDRTGLRERILLELHRKNFKEMRWEEIWDCATRIRNLFLGKAMHPDIAAELQDIVSIRFRNRSVAVRSSALDEDEKGSSFAGLHESYVNVEGTAAILKHVQLVWASLWSDAALLYRQEIGLDVEKSAMAVVIQETVSGDASGVVFTRDPNDEGQGIVESVHGLNQGLVDGIIEPDRWFISRQQNHILSHAPARRKYWMIPTSGGVRKAALPEKKILKPPLSNSEVRSVFLSARDAESYFKHPQDVEWTLKDSKLVLLQSRPITTLSPGKSDDKRSWYLSLHRSFENLSGLRDRIENELIPGMIETANRLEKIDLKGIDDPALSQEIQRRWEINHKWVNIYWADFIPYAHGVRLFGQVYNDLVQPDDPYEFVDLLTSTDMASLKRNESLEDLADAIREDEDLAGRLRREEDEGIDPLFNQKLEDFIRDYGDLSCSVTGGSQCVLGRGPLFKLLLEMAARPRPTTQQRRSGQIESLEKSFLKRVEKDQRDWALELLDLARSSYQLRDDDNIYLGRIEAQLLAAVQEARKRIDGTVDRPDKDVDREMLKTAVENVRFTGEPEKTGSADSESTIGTRPRQMVGQPAGRGIAKGKAKIIRRHEDLASFTTGDILICDAVDPNMTFVVPLAAAVVERRGGMLIHGAIIAREYGLPCVTGIPDVTTRLEDGDVITVDGFLGIVTVGTGEL